MGLWPGRLLARTPTASSGALELASTRNDVTAAASTQQHHPAIRAKWQKKSRSHTGMVMLKEEEEMGSSATFSASAAPTTLTWKAWASLVAYMVQNAFAALLVRLTMSYQEELFSPEAAVLMQELVCKLPVSVLFLAMECGGVMSMLSHIALDLKKFRIEWLKMWVPAVLYTIQMNLYYVGFGNVRAAVAQITYQSKILFTAVCSVIILKRKLSLNQWLALCILLAGVLCVQHQGEESASGKPGQSHLLGMVALLAAALCSALASVYLEKMLKSERKPSLWLRNIQLALYGSVVAAINVLRINEYSKI